MENQIFEVKATLAKSVAITGNELLIDSQKVKDIEKFKEALNKTGMMQSAYSIPLSSITEVSFNQASESTKIKYVNEKGKEKKFNWGFNDADLSNQFGEFLGEKLGLSKSEKKESQVKPLLLNSLYLIIAIGATVFLGTMDDTDALTDSSSRRTRGKGAFLKIIVDTIGQTGVFIIGGLISLFLAYQLYKRFTNPASEVLYSK